MDKNIFNRRTFLKSSLLASGLILAPDFLKTLNAKSVIDFGYAKTDPLGYAYLRGITNPIHQIIIAGISAPNSHNTQPWKFRILSDSAFEIYADGDRQLLPIDPLNRQLYHTQGTFLEFAYLASKVIGYECKIQYFPKGVVQSSKFDKFPIARMEIKPSKALLEAQKINESNGNSKPKQNFDPESLFSAIENRQMNRGSYKGEFLTEEDLNRINEISAPSSCSLVYSLGEEKINDLLPIFNEAFVKEISDPDKNEINRIWFRLSKEEIYTKRDGITLEGNGLTNPILWIAKTFFMDMSKEGWNSKSSLKQSSESFANSIQSSKALVFFVTNGIDNEKTWIDVGRDFARYTLAVAKEGVAFHTMNQAFVDSPESNVFQEQFKSKLGLKSRSVIQLAGRLGKADLSFVSPRRDLNEFLK
ncbi:hypothetical protein [Leptospira sp. GIMC2001]|uniref:hypothetical protein n=1 Tax=Leptospira sp. GIMC2001 TaxID=1513297 RepID=UPI00234AEB7F|nr:hypothetical protein [Leptospira sp. GIMC2001]WCL49012.1 hypothetical protein O4O04_17225 [Leptospira sp. GIMC2001]